MKKFYIIIVDTVNGNSFNAKKVKNIINDSLIDESNLFDDKKSILEKNVVIIEFDKNSDNVDINRALLKQHLYVNIMSTTSNTDLDIVDFGSSHKTQNLKAKHIRNAGLLERAFTTRNANALYLLCHEGDDSEHPEMATVDLWTRISWRGLTVDVCHDQLVHVRHPIVGSPRARHEVEIKRWLLERLASSGGSLPFLCLPALLRLTTACNGLTPLECSMCCQPDLVSRYTHLLSTLFTPENDIHSRPLLLVLEDRLAVWREVQEALLSVVAGRPCLSSLVYRPRLHPICQDGSMLLTALLRLFRQSPQDDRLPFSAPQMATLVSDCLRNGGGLPTTKTLLLVIEDLDWISASDLPGRACSWLPERCAPNILVVLLAARGCVQQKSLQARLRPPRLMDLTPHASGTHACTDPGPQHWCRSLLSRAEAAITQAIAEADKAGWRSETLRILAVFHCSLLCAFSALQLLFLLTAASPHPSDDASRSAHCDDDFREKGDSEEVEKAEAALERARTTLTSSRAVEHALAHLVRAGVLVRSASRHGDAQWYSLASGALRPLLGALLAPALLEHILHRLSALLAHHCTDLRAQLLFMPTVHTPNTDGPLKDWLLRPAVLADEHAVPARLLQLWRLVLGPGTDYRAMISGYLASCLPGGLDCVLAAPLPRGAARGRCRALLGLARLAMHVGQYAVAKEMARVLLKVLDGGGGDAAPCTLLAASLHLLFCTLDERLKTFEFVTEQTTPIFRRTVHYGARALLLQEAVVARLAGAGGRGDGDHRDRDLARTRQKLCVAEVRLARIMTHFVFSLDGVEQTPINHHFLPARIKAVTCACLARALEIATRLRDQSLLLEVLMTYGVIQPRDNCKEKILLYRTPLRLALCAYGQSHIFVSRICINIGISYEEQKRYIRAFEYFTLWSHITHELLGKSHCKSVRSCGVFKEPIFRLTAEFIRHLNGECPSDDLETELKRSVGHVDDDDDEEEEEDAGEAATGGDGGNELRVAGVGISSAEQNVSLENMFAMRSSLEQEDDWEVQSSDDETPNYTSAFEQVMEKFQKSPSSAVQSDLLHSVLDPALTDPEDLSPADVAFLHKSQQSNAEALLLSSAAAASASLGVGSDLQGYDGTIMEAIRITRMFRGLQDLSQVLPQSAGSSAELSLATRLMELQRDLQDFLNN